MKIYVKVLFAKDEDDSQGYKFIPSFPSLKTFIFWIFIGVVIFPWAVIFESSKILQKNSLFFQ